MHVGAREVVAFGKGTHGARSRRVPIDDGVEQQLPGQRRPACVAQAQGGGGGQVGPGAAAAQGDALGINPQHFRLSVGPAERVKHIVRRSRKFVLGRKPVIH